MTAHFTRLVHELKKKRDEAKILLLAQNPSLMKKNNNKNKPLPHTVGTNSILIIQIYMYIIPHYSGFAKSELN